VKKLSRRDGIKSLDLGANSLVAAEIGSMGRAFAADSTRRRPNILLLFSDQHNASVMSCAGHPDVRTPGLDRLASKGCCTSPRGRDYVGGNV